MFNLFATIAGVGLTALTLTSIGPLLKVSHDVRATTATFDTCAREQLAVVGAGLDADLVDDATGQPKSCIALKAVADRSALVSN